MWTDFSASGQLCSYEWVGWVLHYSCCELTLISRFATLCKTFYNWKLLFTAVDGKIDFRIHCGLFRMHSFPFDNGEGKFTLWFF